VPPSDPKQIPTYGPLTPRDTDSPPPSININNVSSNLVRTTQVRASAAVSNGNLPILRNLFIFMKGLRLRQFLKRQLKWLGMEKYLEIRQKLI
jgi:hypothetical protein